jgi:hypothetical protein
VTSSASEDSRAVPGACHPRTGSDRGPWTGEALGPQGVVADVFVVGGAAMALAYDAARVTR